jgi:hypothetical protein
VAVPSDHDLDELLGRLEIEEREISRLRAKLHDRLASFPNPVTQAKEREISKRRRELHAQIDQLRAQRARRDMLWQVDQAPTDETDVVPPTRAQAPEPYVGP